MRRRGVVALLALVALLGGCEKLMRNMYKQPYYRPYAASPLFPNGASARPPVPHTLAAAEGDLAGTSSGRVGAQAVAQAAKASAAPSMPYPVTLKLLRRGRSRFDIYCAPCHGLDGYGDGMVARRGFPHPPSYHTKALRELSDRNIFEVITDGYGIMHAYGDRVAPADRWAIVAYIRALQLSQDAKLSQAPPQEAKRLEAEK